MSSEIDNAAIIATLSGAFAVLLTYYLVFRNEQSGYFNSRFWLEIPETTTRSLFYGLQIPAAFGYLTFVSYATGLMGKRPQEGILQYWDKKGLTLMICVFSLASVAWPIFTKSYLDNNGGVIPPVISLVIASVAAILMTAGAFEADMEWPAILGILVFSTVVVMADGVGWNAKLLHNHSKYA